MVDERWVASVIHHISGWFLPPVSVRLSIKVAVLAHSVHNPFCSVGVNPAALLRDQTRPYKVAKALSMTPLN